MSKRSIFNLLCLLFVIISLVFYIAIDNDIFLILEWAFVALQIGSLFIKD